jgi:branched-chain amino acid transport system ATP-binding protein
MIENGAFVLEVQNLYKHFGGVKAVDGVNLRVEEGELSSIIGPNGAGKTTFINLLTKHIPFNSGKIFFYGEDITSLKTHEIAMKGIVRSFQRTSIFQNLTVVENVETPILIHQRIEMNVVSPASKMFRENAMTILSAVGLSDQAQRIARTLPYGDQRRLEIAIALACKPKLLLLDEPTAGMSRLERMETAQLVLSLSKGQNLTILFTEHDMDIVFSISKKIHVMHNGRLICTGTPEEVRNNDEVHRVYLGDESE